MTSGGEYTAEPFFYPNTGYDYNILRRSFNMTNPVLTFCPCYPACSPRTGPSTGVPQPHIKVSDTHCVRCELQAKYPSMFDQYGHPMPARPAPPTYTPQPQPKRGTPAAIQQLMGNPVPPPPTWVAGLPDASGEFTGYYDQLPDQLKVTAPDFVGPRGTYKVEKLGWDWHNDDDVEKGYREATDYSEANLVGSKTYLEEDGHLPCIDLDLPAHLEPSTQEDHYHLYLNKVVPWDKYVNLLKAMYEAGLVNEGFYVMSVKRGQSFVRRPGVFKKPGEDSS